MTSKRPRSTQMTRGEVASILRAQIVAGAYAPGAQLPSRNEMCETMSGSYVTIQAAIKKLEAEGFVRSERGKATFVTDHPPHLCHYGMLIPRIEEELEDRGADRFLSILAEEARRFNAREAYRRISLFFDTTSDLERRGYHSLLELVRSRRLAGVIYPFPPRGLIDTPLFRDPAVMHATPALPEFTAPNLCHVVLHRQAFYQRALALMAAAGRRRVAVLSTMTGLTLEQGELPQLIGAWGEPLGISTKPFWILPLDPHLAPGIHATTRLLFDAPADLRPDGLIIDDDHMVPAATRALAEAGVDTRTQVTVVGHCNFPDPPPADVPITRIGFDATQLLLAMVATIDQRIAGEQVPQVTLLDPLLEREYAERDHL